MSEVAETFKYYIPFLIVETGGRTGAGHTFLTTLAPIETENDIRKIQQDIEQEGSLAAKSVTLLDWKRIL